MSCLTRPKERVRREDTLMIAVRYVYKGAWWENDSIMALADSAMAKRKI